MDGSVGAQEFWHANSFFSTTLVHHDVVEMGGAVRDDPHGGESM